MAVNFHELKTVGLSYMSLVIQSLGPYGLFVPIKSPPNNIILSSCGIDLIDALPPPSPISKLILAAIKTHHQVYGDATKSFIIVLSNVLTNIKALCDKELNGCMARPILMHELQRLEPALNNVYQAIRKQLLPRGGECLKQLIETFFTGKFSPPISSHLSGLMLELVSKFGSCLRDNLHAISTYFEAICLKEISSATTSSKVMPGMILDYPSRGCDTQTLAPGPNTFFAILKNLSEDSFKSCGNTTLFVDSGEDVNIYCQHHYLHWKRFLDKLVRQGVVLLLVEGNSPDVVALCCKHLGLVLLDRLSADQIELITSITGTLALNELDDTVSTSMGSFETLDCFSVEGSPFIRFHFNSSSFTPHSLMLQAPTPTLCAKYYEECRNCVQMLLVWQADYQTSPSSSIIPSNGFWEMHFARLCFQQAQSSRTQPISSSLWDSIGHSILSIPKALHHNSGHPGRFICMWQAFQNNEIQDSQGLEATVIKETMISSIITLVKQLISIDNIIKVRRIKPS